MDSIISKEKRCYLCGSTSFLEKHHIFNGADRKKSEKYGLKVYLCHNCHNEPPSGVHHNAQNNKELKAIGQKAFAEKYPTLDFFTIFKRNYL